LRAVSVRCLVIGALACGLARPAAAEERGRLFAGTLLGFSILSGGSQAETSASEARLSIYDPENGLAVNVFGGIHLAQYFSIQGNWMWNRNDLTLSSSIARNGAGAFFRQERHSRQHVVVLDTLLYFRPLDSAVRPYLGTGLAVIRFTSEPRNTFSQGLSAPAGAVDSTRLGVRSHVGIDLRLTPALAFRYSFSETISGDPIGPSLTPPRRRVFMNFQNLFGMIGRF
jgi:hypothetical protein